MNILFLTLGGPYYASSRTRVFQYCPHLEKKFNIRIKILRYQSGWDSWLYVHVCTTSFLNRLLFRFCLKGVFFFDIALRRIQLLRLFIGAPFYDLVFIQKVLLPIWAQNFLWRLNKKIVFDFDDALYAEGNLEDITRFNHILKLSKLVVLENDETDKYVKKICSNTVMITGPIDCGRYRPVERRKAPSTVVIGWVGSVSTTKYLALVQQPLKKLCDKYGNKVVFEIVGAYDSDFVFEGVNTRKQLWTLKDEVRYLEDFNIGIMPLFDDEWTRGKGGYKILQYMAMGIPTIASPVGINSQLVVVGKTGFLARTEDEWYTSLDQLIQNEILRKEMGGNARVLAEQYYSFEENTKKLVGKLNEVLEGVL